MQPAADQVSSSRAGETARSQANRAGADLLPLARSLHIPLNSTGFTGQPRPR